MTASHQFEAPACLQSMDKSKGVQVEGTTSPQLELLRDVGGAFRPSILSCKRHACGMLLGPSRQPLTNMQPTEIRQSESDKWVRK